VGSINAGQHVLPGRQLSAVGGWGWGKTDVQQLQMWHDELKASPGSAA
jgi:hypothetical protein